MPRRKREREAYWRNVLTRQSKSGLSVATFCRQESIAQASFYSWRRTIRERLDQLDDAQLSAQCTTVLEMGCTIIRRGALSPEYVDERQ